MIVLGLTGSIGMGKSTTAAMFRALGVRVHSADEVVHRLYEGGPLAAEIEAAFPGATDTAGRVDRATLSAQVVDDPAALGRLEAIVHPHVRAAEAAFLDEARAAGAPLAVLDIPLLFETGAEGRVDKVLVVTAPPDVQRARVLARPGMTPEKLEAILARQLPDAEKRRRADLVLDTSGGLAAARSLVESLLRSLAGGPK
ncbi:dephospho-CoA kinase [Aureimonas leprariae]|uniref:Dephospho-CoA kinase n=1 Tax=Plantimonas leprariae TaxID=2615207 RepID=A0A7V7TW48_9HYPH|nr:dephospho-CoA kinase [Aureimonas leprariae]KAB0679341.1 dephospho-CoA kinase [Aureimonas leprariae]